MWGGPVLDVFIIFQTPALRAMPGAGAVNVAGGQITRMERSKALNGRAQHTGHTHQCVKLNMRTRGSVHCCPSQEHDRRYAKQLGRDENQSTLRRASLSPSRDPSSVFCGKLRAMGSFASCGVALPSPSCRNNTRGFLQVEGHVPKCAASAYDMIFRRANNFLSLARHAEREMCRFPCTKSFSHNRAPVSFPQRG